MNNLKLDLQKLMKGEVDDSPEILTTYSHDASLFEVVPTVVTFPKDTKDVQQLVKYVKDNKADQPGLSITARSAGTDMSGGAINDSVIVDFSKYFKSIESVTKDEAHAQ